MASNTRRDNHHPFLMNEEFVAYFPGLGRALGSIEDAVIVQWLWFRRDRDTDETRATVAEIADAIGMAERTAKDRIRKLKSKDVLTNRRTSAFDPTSVWTVHLDHIPTEDVSAGGSREGGSRPHGETTGSSREGGSRPHGEIAGGSREGGSRPHEGTDPALTVRANSALTVRADSALTTSPDNQEPPTNRGRAGGKEARTTTTAAADALSGAGLVDVAEQDRFTRWLQVTGSTAPARLILALDKNDTLADRITEWRDELARKPREITPSVVPAPRDETGAVIVGELCEHDFEHGRCPMCRRAGKSGTKVGAVA